LIAEKTGGIMIMQIGKTLSFGVLVSALIFATFPIHLSTADESLLLDPSCDSNLLTHPGDFPSHPIGHERENETLLDELKRTGNEANFHYDISYFSILQLKDCVNYLAMDAEHRNIQLEDVQAKLMEILKKLDRIQAVLGRSS